MNQINKLPVAELGYGFVDKKYLPKGKDEYYLRNIQNRSGIIYRSLTKKEKEQLERNNNSADSWDNIKVSEIFNPSLINNCKFFGLVRIGQLENVCLEFHNIKTPVGLYNSTIISCDLGDNVVINNVNILSHFIIGDEVIITNVNEITTTDHAKFGNGILREGENENVRVWLEVCNENAGRKIMPFNGMLPGDAWLWSKYRDDDVLMEKLKTFTEKSFDKRRGYYGKIGDRTVIKNCRIIKDVWIGGDAYLKGANKIKNVTINSSPEAKSQIGEGCELVNGIIGFGCRVFYGVKAVRFFLSSNSQLKYGARLINSYLGDNSTISCCEVLNALIFPAHEQHHNNSFLCAALIMGQSNMAAGATIGSNHNSRGADGEIIAGRGFWPGLCVSLKHNSKFATYTLLAKGDYPTELNIPIPFSLISNDVSKDRLIVMPAYWFMYNMYAIARNAGKYQSRDKRANKDQHLEYEVLAPDSINEMFDALKLLKLFTGKVFLKKKTTDDTYITSGRKLLEEKNKKIGAAEIIAEGFENSERKVVLLKVQESYDIFKRLIIYYCTNQFIDFIEQKNIGNWKSFKSFFPKKQNRESWVNIGGQLITEHSLQNFLKSIHSGNIKSWDEVHNWYLTESNGYTNNKFKNAFASLLEILEIKSNDFTLELFSSLLQQAVETKEWITNNIYESRAKDYQNDFRKMVYDNQKQMDAVVGSFKENIFIQQQKEELAAFKKKVSVLAKILK